MSLETLLLVCVTYGYLVVLRVVVVGAAAQAEIDRVTTARHARIAAVGTVDEIDALIAETEQAYAHIARLSTWWFFRQSLCIWKWRHRDFFPHGAAT